MCSKTDLFALVAVISFLQPLSGIIPDAQAASEPPKVFRDCPAEQQCPEMLSIPSAETPVTLGSPMAEVGRIDNEAEFKTTVPAFALGKFEVTVAQYKACISDGGCKPPEWLEPGNPQNVETGSSPYYRNFGTSLTADGQPVVGVSFDDARAYAAWLSQKTGKRYRLPSEVEWEYAARAGSAAAYSWGDAPDDADGNRRANCQGCGGQVGRQSMPVGSFPPNAWGLHDMHGNVWEWVDDYYCADNAQRPANGRPRSADDCSVKDAAGLRVFRGGSSFYAADKMRSASRLRNFENFRNISVGFRVARDPD